MANPSRPHALGWVFLACAFVSGSVSAQPKQEPASSALSQPQNKANVSPQQIQQLIDRLGSSQFQERELASAALLEIGEPALLPLFTAERGHDAEVSSRAKAIRERIEHDRFEAISLRFKRDPDPNASYGLPGWKSFSKVSGASRPAKRLFLEMLDKRSVVALCLESLEGGRVPEGVFDGMPIDPQARLRAVVGKACVEIRVNAMSGETATGDLIALLIAVQVLEEPSLELHETAKQLCNRGELNRMMQMPGAAASARKIMGAWFLKAPVLLGGEVLNWANIYRIPEGRQMALRMLDSPIEGEVKADALMSLSQFGLPEDLPAIEKFISDAEVVEEFTPMNEYGDVRVDAQGPLNNRAQPQRKIGYSHNQTVGDMALMAACKISGMELKIFPVIRVSENDVVLKHSVGFPVDNPAVRADAVKAYKEFRARASRPAS